MKKTLSIFMICVILLTINSLSISSNVSAEELNSDYIELTKTLQVNDIDSSVLNKVNAIVVSDELKEKDKELFDEVMDNGTGIIVENTNISKVQEYFDVDTIPTSENNLGCYVYKNTDVTQIIPLECNILKDEESNKKITSKDYDSLLKNTKIDYNQVIDDYAALDQEDIFENLDDKTLASLQVEPAIEDSFAYNSKFVYLYRSKEKNDEKEFDKKWVKKTSELGSGKWIQMGSLKLVIFAIKIATNKKVTYDHVVAITSASPCDGHRVKEFRNGISVSNPDTDDIADYTIPDGGINRSVTSSVETSYTKDGAATAYSLSYSYNPDGMDVTPKLYENRIRWTCEPANSPTNNNETFKFEPSIILRKSNGKTSQTTVKSYVSYFRINGLSKKKYVAEETISCGITFKNHKLISKT